MQSEELFERISQLANVKKLTTEQMQDCMDKNADQIRRVSDRVKTLKQAIDISFVSSITLDRRMIKSKRLIEIQSMRSSRGWLHRKHLDSSIPLSVTSRSSNMAYNKLVRIRDMSFLTKSVLCATPFAQP